MCLKPKIIIQPPGDPVNELKRCILAFLIAHGHEVISFSDDSKKAINSTAFILVNIEESTIEIELNVGSELTCDDDVPIHFTDIGPYITISQYFQFIHWYYKIFRRNSHA